MSALQQAKQDIKSHVSLDWDRQTWDQWNVSVSHIFTTENHKLNKQIKYVSL